MGVAVAVDVGVEVGGGVKVGVAVDVAVAVGVDVEVGGGVGVKVEVGVGVCVGVKVGEGIRLSQNLFPLNVLPFRGCVYRIQLLFITTPPAEVAPTDS